MRWMAFVATVGLLVAGCAGQTTDGSAPADLEPGGPAPPVEFSETRGAIAGSVVDEEILPLQAAQVQLAPAGLQAVTDAAGRFTFNLLEPGTYDVFVSKLGHSSAGKRVTVVAGQASAVNVGLTRLAVDEAYTASFQQRGLLGCAVQVDPATGVSVCGAAAIVQLLTGQNTSNVDRFALFWDVPEPTGPWSTAVFEMRWQSTQVLGRGLQMIWEVNTCSGDPDLTFGIVSGESPLVVRVEHERLREIVEESSKENACLAQGIATFDTSDECNEDRCNLQSRVFASAETTGLAADVGLAVQQPFEQFVTNFYHGAAGADFTALPDA